MKEPLFLVVLFCMQLFYAPTILEGNNWLDPIESGHCIRVLRKREGDEIFVMDGKGSIYTCRITDANQKQCHFKIIEQEKNTPLNYYLHIIIAPTKNIERLEWFLEKATEIGVHEITFVLCSRSERKNIKPERLQKVLISAMKQSKNTFLPKLNDLVSFKNVFKTIDNKEVGEGRYIGYCEKGIPSVQLKELIPSKQKIIMLIGPEGDFSEEEIQIALDKDFEIVSLGKHRLRTETAGVVVCSTVHLVKE